MSRTSIVLPVPGGPKRRTPLGGARRPVNMSGRRLGRMIDSWRVLFATVRPAMASKGTPGAWSIKSSRMRFSRSVAPLPPPLLAPPTPPRPPLLPPPRPPARPPTLAFIAAFPARPTPAPPMAPVDPPSPRTPRTPVVAAGRTTRPAAAGRTSRAAGLAAPPPAAPGAPARLAPPALPAPTPTNCCDFVPLLLTRAEFPSAVPRRVVPLAAANGDWDPAALGPGRDANKDVMADQMPVPLYEVLGEAFFFGGCGAALCDLSSSARDIHSWMRAPMSWRPSGEVSPLVWGGG